MRQLFSDIKAKILAVAPDILFVAMYNGQFEDIDEDGAEIYSFPCPFVLIEFSDDIQWNQLGGGVQIADPLEVVLHYGHYQLDAQDGTQEQNLDVYDKVEALFVAMNLYEPDGAVAFVRSGATQDKRHRALYHAQQKYITNYITQAAAIPVGGVDKDPPFTLEINASYEEPPYTKTIPG